MLNGDSITGASDVKTVTVETEWGVAKINGENISSMMFVPGLEWQNAKGLNGNRWTLTEAKAKPAGTSPAHYPTTPSLDCHLNSITRATTRLELYSLSNFYRHRSANT